MSSIKLKPIHYFVPFDAPTIERALKTCDFSGEENIVPGYAFVREVVEGEGGLRLKRSAMEAATPDWLAFGNIREMHGKNAAGVCRHAEWDETGLFIAPEIVDPVALAKVKRGVYKGYSVGVAATLMRGKDVDACRILEISLVDRPKDPDALICFRAEGFDPDAEIECLVVEERVEDDAEDVTEPVTDAVTETEPVVETDTETDTERAVTSGTPNLPVRENLEGKPPKAERAKYDDATDSYPGDPNGPAKCARCGGDCTRCTGEERAEEASITRIESLETENRTLIERIETQTTEIARVSEAKEQVERLLASAEEQIKRLEEMPAPNAPVLYPRALTPEFFANRKSAHESEKQEIVTRLATLSALPATPDMSEQKTRAAEILVLRSRLAGLA